VRARLPDEVALWAGIGAYRLPPVQTAANVQAARQRGAAGVLLFSYERPSVAIDDGWPAVRERLRSALLGPAGLDSR
jgi:hypothetical protein